MKKALVVLVVLSSLLVGCGQPKTYGSITDWSEYETDDFHVKYAMGKNGVYSDGSFVSNMMYADWIEKYKAKH